MKTEFDLLIEADERLTLLETKGYKVYQDKMGGIMVKGPSYHVYNNRNEYKGNNEGEQIWAQVEALYRELKI